MPVLRLQMETFVGDSQICQKRGHLANGLEVVGPQMHAELKYKC